jgi:hypothetical protein
MADNAQPVVGFISLMRKQILLLEQNDWNMREDQTSFSFIIQQVRGIEKDHRRNEKINFNLNPKIIYKFENILHLGLEQRIK